MNDDMITALMLMAVGIITVFFILALIVLFGGWLIRIVNRISPELTGPTGRPETGLPDYGVTAAIVASVEITTGGRGKVTEIRKAGY